MSEQKDRPTGIDNLLCAKCGYLIRDGLGSLQSKVVDGKVVHIKCPTQKVVTKQDRPDREKIARLLHSFRGKTVATWESLQPSVKRERLADADQIIALFPDVEEIEAKARLTVQTELALERDIIKQINEAKIEEVRKQVIKELEGLFIPCYGGNKLLLAERWKRFKEGK